MAPKYILHYYKVPARGEPIRILFNLAGVEFEEKNFVLTKDIPVVKAKDDLYPLGVLPVLELENGEMMAESHAITRYLAREFDFYGKSNHDKAIIDQTLDSLKSVEQSLWEAYFFISDPKAKQERLKTLFEDTATRTLRMIENFLKKNNNGKSFLVGESVSIGDIQILAAVETFLLPANENYRDIVDKFPLVKDLNEKVRELPRIKAYLDKRGPPVYNFVH